MLHEGESFTELSVERIVAAAGISRSTFYVYFEDKGDLLRALTEDVISQMLEVSHHWWDLDDPDPEKLHEALSELVEAYRKHRTLLGAMTDTSTYDEGVRAELHEMMRTAQRELAAHLQERSALRLRPRGPRPDLGGRLDHVDGGPRLLRHGGICSVDERRAHDRRALRHRLARALRSPRLIAISPDRGVKIPRTGLARTVCVD